MSYTAIGLRYSHWIGFGYCSTLFALAAVALPLNPPRLKQHTSMSGFGYYSFAGKATSTAALYQDDDKDLLRLDLGNLTEAPPQLHAYFTSKGEHVEFLEDSKHRCLNTKADGSPGLTYTGQLAAYVRMYGLTRAGVQKTLP